MIGRRGFVTGLRLLGTPVIGRVAFATPDDALFNAGLVLGTGPEGRCDDARLGGPVVRWDPASDAWRMWYYGRRQDFPADVAPEFGTGRIATATSTDGFHWQRIDGPLEGGAVFEPAADPAAFDFHHVATGDVFRHDDQWWLVYFGGNDEMPQNAAPTYRYKGYHIRIGLARSDDGVHFTRTPGSKPGGSVIEPGGDDVYAAFPCIVHDGERFLMHYTTVDKQGRFSRARIAASRDGVSWAELGDLQWEHALAPFESGGLITKDVMLNPFGSGPRWLMVYTAKDGRKETGGRRSIGTAVSDDAITWRHLHPGRYLLLALTARGTPRALPYHGWSSPRTICAFTTMDGLMKRMRITPNAVSAARWRQAGISWASSA